MQLPFQRWFKFKEAFSPSLIVECLQSAAAPVKTCLDPFGGCGTTGVTCQFLGVRPVLVEVNPFIADLAEAKLASYDRLALLNDFVAIVRDIRGRRPSRARQPWPELPATFCEPGIDGRWLFGRETMARIMAYRDAIETLDNKTHARLFRVLLGSVLVACSNAVVNGKGRKYRGQWQQNQKSAADVDRMVSAAFAYAIEDLERYASRAERGYQLIRGSCVTQVENAPQVDAAIFSPPYPNSFDYTDIYNIELWVLGYLTSSRDNLALRQATLRSHVQCTFKKTTDEVPTPKLRRTLRKLAKVRADLWDPRIPEMVAGYFGDLAVLLGNLRQVVRPGGSTFIVVGDSCYRGIPVRVADILEEVAADAGFSVRSAHVVRKMRTSAQQGGGHSLNESVLHLKNQNR
jgi:DNA modification methylase